jgi:NosR/NirI family transcriptional regulator, nitrous oxide reductase regulator
MRAVSDRRRAGRPSRYSRIVAVALAYAGLLFLSGAAAGASHGGAEAYDAPLPAELAQGAELCAYVPCGDVLPGADAFSPRKGRPPYAEAYRTAGGRRELAGYVFLSTDIVDIPAYSGKPVVTLIGMDTRGTITGAKVLRHSEPILLLGIPESKLNAFIAQYVGRDVGDRFEVGGAARNAPGVVGVDAITGATVTVIAQNQVMNRAAAEVAKEVGILAPTRRAPAAFERVPVPSTWRALVAEGAVERLLVQPGDVGMVADGRPYIDIWFGYLNHPAVGRAVLGGSGYDRLMAGLAPGDHAIFLVARGMSSFKGSGFVRGGIFDRIQVTQGNDTFTFRDLDYQNLYAVSPPDAPDYAESGIFLLRGGDSFSAAYPWNLVLLAYKVDQETGAKAFTSFAREYWVPSRYLAGGRPRVARPDPVWVAAWKARAPEIAAFVALLAFTGGTYALRDRLVRRSRRRDKRWVTWPKTLGWIASIVFVGGHAMAQPSITQVLTWFHSLLFHWKWELFLSDPFVFVFWWFIIVTVFLWGRGVFCGWMCPFGSLTEVLYKLGRWAGLGRFQFQLPRAWHDRLKWVKYGAFWTLLAASFFSMGVAEKMAEIEPFKTTFLVGLLNRAWPYTLFAGGLLGLSVFVERPFCKYLCPLGAALAMPSTFRWFGLKRKEACTKCAACAVGCGSQAIDARGAIDRRECLACLDCMVMYYDDAACPPLVHERKRRTRAGLALTPVGGDGYFIPIRPATGRSSGSGSHV